MESNDILNNISSEVTDRISVDIENLWYVNGNDIEGGYTNMRILKSTQASETPVYQKLRFIQGFLRKLAMTFEGYSEEYGNTAVYLDVNYITGDYSLKLTAVEMGEQYGLDEIARFDGADISKKFMEYLEKYSIVNPIDADNFYPLNVNNDLDLEFNSPNRIYKGENVYYKLEDDIKEEDIKTPESQEDTYDFDVYYMNIIGKFAIEFREVCEVYDSIIIAKELKKLFKGIHWDSRDAALMKNSIELTLQEIRTTTELCNKNLLNNNKLSYELEYIISRCHQFYTELFKN